MDADIAQAHSDEDEAQLVARLRLFHDVSEAPQMISEEQQCAVIEKFKQVRKSRLHRHVP